MCEEKVKERHETVNKDSWPSQNNDDDDGDDRRDDEDKGR